MPQASGAAFGTVTETLRYAALGGTVRRLAATTLTALVVALVAATAVLGVHVIRMEREARQLEARVSRAEQALTTSDTAIEVTSAVPAMSSTDLCALAEYAVSTRKDLDGLAAALERDIHDRPLLSRHALLNTHFWLDGRTWPVEMLTLSEVEQLEATDGPYLAYPER